MAKHKRIERRRELERKRRRRKKRLKLRAKGLLPQEPQTAPEPRTKSRSSRKK
jgi:hypothetical protein